MLNELLVARTTAAALVGLMLSAMPALAANPACEPLSDAEFADRIHASLDAIQRADVPGHQAIVRDLEQRLPCLEFVPSPERWAELLVGIAIIEYAQGGEWQGPLTTALHIHPSVTRLVGPSHEMYSWEPPAALPPTDQQIPDGVRIYLDGELLTLIPQTRGIHLVQRRTGDGWTTLLLQEDEEIPSGWFDEPSLLARRGISKRVSIRAVGGLASTSQRVDNPGDFLSDTSSNGFGLGLGVSSGVGIAEGPGLTTRLLGLGSLNLDKRRRLLRGLRPFTHFEKGHGQTG